MRGLLGTMLVALAVLAHSATAERGPVVLGADHPAAVPAAGTGPRLKVYKYTDRTGATSFSDRAPSGQKYQVVTVMLGCYACNPRSTVDWNTTPLHLSAFKDIIDTTANEFGIDPALVRAVIHAESAFQSNAKSRAGALGLMQLMPDTASDMGVADPYSPQENIQGGVRYLAWLLEKNHGDTTLATAAYNAGPGAVERFKGIPPYEETEVYVKRVKILHARYRDALSKTS
ncbi:lytic transglycosylase domain-containing protein [Haliea sp. E17]|uniref:lytic transglycosylase domain-containing protein n=1 Tax=Haliea sp. E17 TaxID=3401576 RepID=UPI003AB03E07